MKKLLLSLLAPIVSGGMFASAFAQNDITPCCGIIARDVNNNLVIARDNTTGRLNRFKADNPDIKSIRKGDAVHINLQSKKITAINGAVRSYPIIQPDKAEPPSILMAMRIDNAQPVNDMVTPKIKNAEPVSKPTVNTNSAAPISDIVSIQVVNIEPINDIVTPKINNAEPVSKPTINNAEPPSMVSAKNKQTGKIVQFNVPAVIAKTLKIGDPVYIEPINGIQINYLDPVNGMNIQNAEPINDFAIVQSSFGSSNGQMASYGYGATSGDGTTGNAGETDKWVITPVKDMKGVLGRLDINFPADAERNILIYQPADNKFITSVSRNDKMYTIAPGPYNFTITNVRIDNVPIQKGHETRLKAGLLNVVSDGNWILYSDTKEKQYTSGNTPKKLPLPVGNYQLKLGTQFYPVAIKDKETVEF